MLGPEPGDGAVIGGPFGRNHLVGDLGLTRLLDSRAGTNSFANATRWPGCEFLSTVTDLITLLDQLKALGEIKSALATIPDPKARELEGRVHQLLEASFRSGRFAQI